MSENGSGQEGASLPIASIDVSGRHRRDMGDIPALALSISEVGLLHPVVVTPAGRLVAGQRRLEACRSLGWTRIPVSVAAGLDDARDLLQAERDENTCREEMTPSEKVALGMALEELERPRAAQRQIESRGNRAENFTARPDRGYTREIVGESVGMSGPTYQRAKTVVLMSEDTSLAPEVREVAREARAEMDRTGKVSGAYNRIARASGRATTKPERQEYNPMTERQKQLASGQRRRLITALSGIDGFCRGLAEIDLSMARAACDSDDLRTWADQARDSSRQLARLAKQLHPEGGNGKEG